MGRYEGLRHKIGAGDLPFPLYPLWASRHPVQAQGERCLASAIRAAAVALPDAAWTGPRREARGNLDKREWQIDECVGRDSHGRLKPVRVNEKPGSLELNLLPRKNGLDSYPLIVEQNESHIL